MSGGPRDAPSRPLRADGASRLAYMPGVDGLRAVAVAAVVVFHLGAAWLPGGFLGVDVFLVISGYLITSLLLAEHEATGRIDLVRFWLRRARRLLPALFLVMAVTLAAMLVLHADEVADLRGASLASLAYVTNWYFVFADVPYFAQFGRPSVFLHLWSLAVEEQFYLVWPPLLAAGLALAGRRVMLAVAMLGVAASTALAWWLFDPFSASDRIYYGTDTRAVGLLAGVVLAFVLPAGHLRPAGAAGRRFTDLAGLAAAAVLAVILLRLDETQTFLYRGGFLTVGLVTAVLLAAAARPGTWTGRVLGAGALVWVGRRSYGIYLWHWPVIQLTRPGEDVSLDGAPLVAVQVALTVTAAALSYRFVETPIRRHGLAGIRAWFSRRAGARAAVVRRAGAAVGVAAVVALVVGVAVAPPRQGGLEAAVAQPGTAPAAGADRRGAPVLFVGDSVMLVASPELRRTFGARARIDARVGRRFPEGAAIALAGARQLPAGSPVVVHLGSNYFIRPEELEAFLTRAPAGHPVFLVTVRAPFAWQDPVNALLRDAPAAHPGVRVIDWFAASGGPGLLVDGAHTNARGARLYAQLIARALRGDPS